MSLLSLAPKKSLGQNWLIDATYLDRIVAAAELTAADIVLEIGPGPGNMTRRLAAQAGHVIAVELDDRLIEPLRQQFAAQPQVVIVHGDILELDPGTLLQSPGEQEAGLHEATISVHPYKVVANLPYYITSAVLRHVLEAQPSPTLAVLMVQHEVAARICAAPGDMSVLAVSVQFYAQPRLIQRVPASAFRPQPKVDSAVLRLDVYPQPVMPHVEPATFFKLVRAGFSQKRKQLRNTLSAALALGKEQAVALLQEAGIEPTRRAETLALTEWGALYQAWTRPTLQEKKNL